MTIQRKAVVRGLVLLAGFALLGACGDSSDDPHPDAEGCEHLKEGPKTAVAATGSADLAPVIEPGHRRHDVTLVDGAGGKQGFVRFAAPEATDFVFFVNADVPMRFRGADGVELTPEESAKTSAACSEIKGRHVVPMTVGTHTVNFGPTPVGLVQLVAEEAAHDHDHDRTNGR